MPDCVDFELGKQRLELFRMKTVFIKITNFEQFEQKKNEKMPTKAKIVPIWAVLDKNDFCGLNY